MLGLTYSPPVTDRSAGNTRQVTTEAGLPVGTLTIDRARGRVAFNRPDKQFTQWHRLPRLGDAMLDAVAYAREAGLLPESLPAGITSFTPAPYRERRWNGAVWPVVHTDAYNTLLRRIQARHAAGMPVTALVDGLYNMAAGFDVAGKPAPVRTARLCKSHGWQAMTAPIDPAVVDACPNCRVTTP